MDPQVCREALQTVYQCSSEMGLSAFANISWSTIAASASAFLMISAVFLRGLAEALGWVAARTKNQDKPPLPQSAGPGYVPLTAKLLHLLL